MLAQFCLRNVPVYLPPTTQHTQPQQQHNTTQQCFFNWQQSRGPASRKRRTRAHDRKSLRISFSATIVLLSITSGVVTRWRFSFFFTLMTWIEGRGWIRATDSAHAQPTDIHSTKHRDFLALHSSSSNTYIHRRRSRRQLKSGTAGGARPLISGFLSFTFCIGREGSGLGFILRFPLCFFDCFCFSYN